MSAILTGGPAFPGPFTNDSDMNTTAPDGQLVPPGYTVEMPGMSLRDFFAAQAMSGLLAHRPFAKDDVARAAYEQADAMLEARRK